MTLEMWDGVIGRDFAFRSAKRQVDDMMRSASARFVERDFDPGIPQRVLSDFSSLGVGVEDFADYFVNVSVLLSKYQLLWSILMDFRFVILISSNVF
jgi:hypothetical protein